VLTPEQQAIAALWLFIQAGILGIARWLVSEKNKCETRCEERIAKLEVRLDEGAATMRRLNEVLQKQVDAHEMTISRLTTSERTQR
jgi:hypothetical protein